MKSEQQLCARSAHCSVQRGQLRAACKLISMPTWTNARRCSSWRNGSRASNSNAISIAPNSTQSSPRSSFRARRPWFTLTQLNGRKAWIRWRFIEPPLGPPIDLWSQTRRENSFAGKRETMRRILISVAISAAMMTAGSGAKAQVDLSAYADPEGFLDIQALTCAQLAGTWQDQADLLSSWYSGWYNGLAKRHYMDIRKGREAEHELIVYCKANPQLRIIQAMDVVFKSMRERMGIKVQ